MLNVVIDLWYKLKNFIREHYLYIVACIVFTMKAILFNCLLGMQMDKQMVIITMAIPMLLLLPVANHKGKKAFLYANIIYFIITLLLYCNFVYYQFSTNFLSVYQIQNLKYANEIGMGAQYLITIKDIALFFTDNIIFALFSIWILKKRKQSNDLIRKKSKWGILTFSIVVIMLNIIIYQEKIESTYDYYRYNKTLAIEHISIYYYHFCDMQEFVKEELCRPNVDLEVLKEQYQKNKEEKSKEIQYEDIAKGSNVIILQLESFHEFLIQQKINGQEITPNLNRFYQENIYCTNMYNQGLGTTADSEHSLATSMYPLENGMAFQKYFANNWYDIYQDLKAEGYYTSFMHPNVSTFWNRYEVYHKGYKIQEYNDIDQFDSNGQMAGEFFSDEQFLVQSVEKMKEYQQPFASMLVSVSSHIPFSLEGIENLEQKLTIDVSGIEDQEFANYIASCNFVDYSFGKWLEKLEESGLLENSILVVYGDHGAGIQNNEQVVSLMEQEGKPYGVDEQKVENVHVPFGMKVPGLKNIRIDRAVSKIDVKPTIESLLGVKDRFSIGESLFTQKDYSFIKGLGFVTSDIYYIDGEVIDRKTNQRIEIEENIDFLIQKMNSDIEMSDTMIKGNLFMKKK